jgi:hypothetical protein
MDSHLLRPLASAWLEKCRIAIEHKRRFNDTAEQCMAFFNGAVGFMWDAKFLQKYVGGQLTPTFKITLAKAFELVALFGPTLYWRNPTRLVKPRPTLQLDPALFGGLDPLGWIMYQQATLQSQQQQAVDKIVSSLLELYLNYTPNEQPGGGLSEHASSAITEALVKGRGCLWPRPYFMPGSNRVLTGCFYDSVDNLLIDPDATSLNDATWIAQRCIQPTWEVERTFGLPPGTLRGRGTHESIDAQSRDSGDPWSTVEQRVGRSNDLLTYFKIWSKCGVGGRLSGQAQIDHPLASAFDEVVGDYAYCVVAPNVPFLLNLPTEILRSATDSEIKRRLGWPAPFWRDDRWPVAILDFYKAPNDPWAIAPLAPGLGELAYINMLASHIAHHVWMCSRSFPAMPEDTNTETRAAILSGRDLSPIYYKRSAGQNATDLVSFIQHPAMNRDVWKGLDFFLQTFDRRVGLTELLYGLNPGGVQSRTAEDVATKREMVSIRPDYMAGRVEDWMGEAAEMEKLCCSWFIEPSDLQGLFGPVEQMLWQRYITSADPEHIVRELRVTIAANSTRKPDKTRDVQNMQQILPNLLPVMQQHFMTTGDVSGINGLLMKWGQTIDQDMSQMLLPPLQMPENPEADAAAQAQQAELDAFQQKMQRDQERHQQALAMNAQRGQQDWMLHLARMAAMQQQMDLRKKQAAQKPKAKAT